MKKSGFTIIEAILALIITALCIFTLSLVVTSLKQVAQKQPQGNELAYSYVQLKHFLESRPGLQIDLEQSNPSSLRLIPTETQDQASSQPLKSYRIGLYRNMLRVTGDSKGHIPLLLEIKGAEFEFTKSTFTVTITEKDGRKSQWYYVLSTHEGD